MKYSKEGQDIFAMLCFPEPGYFLDLGTAHPTDGNNTIRLEEAGWRGLRFDINPAVAGIPATRKSPLVIGDISEPGFILKHTNGIRFFDYISFDVDGATVEAVKNFPWRDIRFGCMTFEHDKRDREVCLAQEVMDRHLRQRDYVCLARDVQYEDNGLHIFEDWWIDPERVSSQVGRHIGHFDRPQSWLSVLSLLNAKPIEK